MIPGAVTPTRVRLVAHALRRRGRDLLALLLDGPMAEPTETIQLLAGVIGTDGEHWAAHSVHEAPRSFARLLVNEGRARPYVAPDRIATREGATVPRAPRK